MKHRKCKVCLSFSLNARLVLSTQCFIMAKDYVIMLKRGVILVNQYVVLFNCVVSEKKTFKTYIFLHVYYPGARVDNPQGDKVLIVTKMFNNFYHTV